MLQTVTVPSVFPQANRVPSLSNCTKLEVAVSMPSAINGAPPTWFNKEYPRSGFDGRPATAKMLASGPMADGSHGNDLVIFPEDISAKTASGELFVWKTRNLPVGSTAIIPEPLSLVEGTVQRSSPVSAL